MLLGGIKRYLVGVFENGESIDRFAYNMVSTNKIPGILPMKFVNDNGCYCYRYDLNQMQSLAALIQGYSLKQVQALKIFSNIADVLINIDKYMLTDNCFIFDENYIFVDADSCETAIVCSGKVQEGYYDYDMGSFLYGLRSRMIIPPMANQDYLMPRIDAYLTSGSFDVVEFKKLLGECMDRMYTVVERSVYEAETGIKTELPVDISTVEGKVKGSRRKAKQPKRIRVLHSEPKITKEVKPKKAEKKNANSGMAGLNIKLPGERMTSDNKKINLPQKEDVGHTNVTGGDFGETTVLVRM